MRPGYGFTVKGGSMDLRMACRTSDRGCRTFVVHTEREPDDQQSRPDANGH